jgi:citrate synthase
MSESTWTTAITHVAPNEVRVRGYDIADLMGRVSFGAVVYLLLRGELPDERTGRLMDAILVSSVDHGATPPSVLAARTVASTGAALSAAVAAGVLSINRHHGGAIEDCAIALGRVADAADRRGGDAGAAAAELLGEMKRQGQRMAGFGHRIHTEDPRTARLFALAEAAGAAGRHVAAARAVERAFAKSGKPLPINVDGAMGAILADLGFPPAVMNGLFMVARCAGLVAHVHEEQTRMKPMRRIDPVDHAYDGPPPRSP